MGKPNILMLMADQMAPAALPFYGGTTAVMLTTELFLAEIRKGWDLDRIAREVLASQRRQRLVGGANAIDVFESWDYQPRRDASSEYVRSHLDLEVISRRGRVPTHY